MSKGFIDIDQYENEILKDFVTGKLKSVKHSAKEIKLATQAASNYVKRDSRVNIRISGADLNMIRRIAIQEGLPYQTLLASIVHKFVAGRLIDKGDASQTDISS